MSVLLNNWLNYQIHIVKLCRMNRIIMMMIHKMSISSFLSTPDWLAALIAVSSFLNVSSNKGYEDVSSEIWGCILNQKMKPVCFMFHASSHIFCFQQHSVLYFVWDIHICSQCLMLSTTLYAFLFNPYKAPKKVGMHASASEHLKGPFRCSPSNSI